jgi:hypothetical protein
MFYPMLFDIIIPYDKIKLKSENSLNSYDLNSFNNIDKLT